MGTVGATVIRRLSLSLSLNRFPRVPGNSTWKLIRRAVFSIINGLGGSSSLLGKKGRVDARKVDPSRVSLTVCNTTGMSGELTRRVIFSLEWNVDV